MSEAINQPQSLNGVPEADQSSRELVVVGIGASAGGLSALEKLFDCLPSDSGAAFVVIQHLSPDFKSLMKELLERHTKMKIYRVVRGMILEPNSIYLIPPGKNLTLKQNVLELEERKKSQNDRHEFNFPIDLFFNSLAKNYQDNAIGVILSGTGSDGTYGLRAIHEAGGVALVQDPRTAEFDGMPLSAISTGIVNQVLPISELANLIHQCIISPTSLLDSEDSEHTLLTYSTLKKIANLLAETEGVDFSFYKTGTMSRRINRRRLIRNIPDIPGYINLLSNSVEERKILAGDLLINVTRFFRDQPAWQEIADQVLPMIIEEAKPNEELRFWVAGCSTGEEAYTLAILVYEALESADKLLTAKIFATDIDRVALEKAGSGIYPRSIAQDVTPERLQKHFVLKENCYQTTRKLRKMLIFSAHDLTKDAGFTRMHLVSCRNVLIYMQNNLQHQILRNFHFSLNVKGILFQGEAETPGMFTPEFNTINKKWKIYQKQRDIKLNLPYKDVSRITSRSTQSYFSPKRSSHETSSHEEILLQLLQDSEKVVLQVSCYNNDLLHIYGDSSRIFQPLKGKVVTDVTKMVVFPLRLPLNTALHRARKENQSVVYTGISLEHEGNFYKVSLKVIPDQQETDQGDFYLIEIEQKAVQEPPKPETIKQLEVSNEAQRQILELEEELQHTRENLQALIEELETTNEEQQASNEELTSSNEELQSTNEELHSVNEELHTVNIEYQTKIQELVQLNNDIDNLLQSTNIGVIFLDSELKIRKFTPAAVAIVSLRSADLERPLKELNFKIECPQLLQLLEDVLDKQEPIELEVKQKESNDHFLLRITPYQTEDLINNGIVISFVGINDLKSAQFQLETTLADKNRQLTAMETASDGIAVLNKDRFVYLNQAHLEIFGYDNPSELSGQSWRVLYQADELARFETEIFPAVLEQGRWQGIVKAKHRDGHLFDEELTLNFTPGGDLIRVCRDVSEIVQARQKLLESNLELERGREKLKLVNEAKDSFISHMSHELRTPLNSILGFSNILQKDSQSTNRQLNSINIIHQSGQHLLTLINDILDFSKINARKLELAPQNFNLILFLVDIEEVFLLRAQEKNLQFKLEIHATIPNFVQADAHRLRQVLYNLLSNALKFTATGSVTLKVSPVKDSKSAASNDNYHLLRFQIEDTGIGIATEQFTDIFTPFKQLNGNVSNYEGTGLGLTISQEILQLMNSKIQLESQPHHGSKFWFDLELLVAEAETITASPELSCLLPRRLKIPRKILVVDDHDANRILLVNYLEPLGFIVSAANNGQEGLTVAQEFQPDVILVDLVMPVMDGTEMIERLRKQPPLQEVIVIVITASSQLEHQTSELDCQDLLAKPIDLDQLLTSISTHLELVWQVEQLNNSNQGINTESTLVMPPQEELIKLQKLTRFGDISGIEAQADYLRSLDEEYLPFIEQVLELITSCQQTELESLLAEYIGVGD